MDAVAFFKLQAKNFLKDWKTRYRDEEGLWQYRSRFIDVDRFFMEAGYGDWGDEEPSLMRAQHFVALICELDSWSELINLPEDELEFMKYVWENQNRCSFDDWADSPQRELMDYMGVDDPETKRYLYDELKKIRETEFVVTAYRGYLIDKPKA